MPLAARIQKTGLPPRRTKAPREGMSAKHLDFVRSLPCVVCGASAEAHHLLDAGAGTRGMGMKAPDRYTVPLCHSHHMELHAHGDETEWMSLRGIDARALSLRLWCVTGNHEQGVRAVERARPIR